MKPFESLLKQKFEEYLNYREKLGYSDNSLKSQLRMFDKYIQKNNSNWKSFDPQYFLTLRESFNTSSRTVNNIICSLRGFFQFLVRLDIYKENPLQDIPAYQEEAYIPFIFSAKQTEQFLSAIQSRLRKKQKYFLTDLAVYLNILLLARCGLRISEPINLLYKNYRAKEGTIYIEKTKFKKDRLIPVPISVITEIDNYLSIRENFEIKNVYLFADAKSKISSNQIYSMFHQVVNDIGINQHRRTIANTTFAKPTPHSLRHSYAVNTLKKIKQKGQSPQNALPILSAYLGHRKYRYTSVYLKVLDAEHRQGLVDFSISKQEEI